LNIPYWLFLSTTIYHYGAKKTSQLFSTVYLRRFKMLSHFTRGFSLFAQSPRANAYAPLGLFVYVKNKIEYTKNTKAIIPQLASSKHNLPESIPDNYRGWQRLIPQKPFG
jgi:hypothetical protein